MKQLFKNKILLGIVAMVLLTSATVIINNTMTDGNKAKEFIYKAGFTNVPEFKDFNQSVERTQWKKLGVNFLTYSEADTLMKLNNFILADAGQYIGHIPDSSMEQIYENYRKVEDHLLNYWLLDDNTQWSDNYKTIALSKKDLGWWLNKSGDNDIRYCWLSDNIYDRLSEIGVKNAIGSGLSNTNNWTLRKDSELSKIQIIAHPSMFVPDVVKDSATAVKLKAPAIPDPMAVVKHRNGVVVLAVWL
jgi:hypothetical protein